MKIILFHIIESVKTRQMRMVARTVGCALNFLFFVFFLGVGFYALWLAYHLIKRLGGF